MIASRLYGICIIFVLHAVTMLLLCPSRFGPGKTAAVWVAAILASVGGCYTIMQAAPHFTGAFFALLLAVLLLVGTVFYLSRSPIPQTLFLLLTYMQAFMVATFLSGFLSHRFYGGSPDASAFFRTILELVIILVCILLRKRFDLLAGDIVKGWWPLNLLAMLLVSYISILTLHLYSTAFSVPLQCLSAFLMIVVLVAVYGVFFHTIHHMQGAATARQMELKNQLLQHQVEAMQDAVEATRHFRHDQRHHNLNIAAFARNGETEALLHYLEEYEQETQRRTPIRLCGNQTIDNILSVYGQRAEDCGIDVHFDVVAEKELGILDTDLVAILANLMENAVQGCVRANVSKPFLEATLKRKSNKLVISVRNTAELGICFENDLPQKKHGDGIGISSIISAAARYSGQTDFQCADGVFTCRVILNLPGSAKRTKQERAIHP